MSWRQPADAARARELVQLHRLGKLDVFAITSSDERRERDGHLPDDRLT
jgi:hypothetical protein